MSYVSSVPIVPFNEKMYYASNAEDRLLYGGSLKREASWVRNNLDLVKIAVRRDPTEWHFASEQVKWDRHLAVLVTSADAKYYRLLPESLRRDASLILYPAIKFPEKIWTDLVPYASEQLQQSPSVMKRLRVLFPNSDPALNERCSAENVRQEQEAERQQIERQAEQRIQVDHKKLENRPQEERIVVLGMKGACLAVAGSLFLFFPFHEVIWPVILFVVVALAIFALTDKLKRYLTQIDTANLNARKAALDGLKNERVQQSLSELDDPVLVKLAVAYNPEAWQDASKFIQYDYSLAKLLLSRRPLDYCKLPQVLREYDELLVLAVLNAAADGTGLDEIRSKITNHARMNIGPSRINDILSKIFTYKLMPSAAPDVADRLVIENGGSGEISNDAEAV